MLPRNSYTPVELRQGTIEWESLAIRLTQKFEFTSEHSIVNITLQIIKEKIFEEISVAAMNFHQCTMTVHNWMECYNIMGEPDDDDPLEINIPESKGMRAVEGAGMCAETPYPDHYDPII